MKKLHRTPMTILVLGIVTVALFGGGVVWISQQTPIVRLHPLLKEQFKNTKIEVRFRPGNDPRIEVLVPSDMATSPYALGDVGVWALAEYLELAPRTHVKVCRVMCLEPTDDESMQVDIDVELIGMLKRAKRQVPELYEEAKKGGLKSGTFKILGVVNSGVHAVVEGEFPKLDAPQAQPIAQEIARVVARATFLSRVTVVLHVKGGKQVTTWGGRDHPRVERK